jgi:hypothetical protein
MKRVVGTLICGCVLLLLNACEMHDMENCLGEHSRGECHCEPWCQEDWNDDWFDDDYDHDSDDYWGGWCQSDAECQQGEVCDPYDQCVPIVENCPLTPECLADPEGYAPEWQGIDPVFVGSFSGDAQGRVYTFIDFYEDHFYGEAEIVLDGHYEWYYVTLTGTLDGNQIFGQAVDPWGDRRFDAVFEATLHSASEMTGTFEVVSDEGTATGEFILYRTSPCGCDPEEEEEEEQPGCVRNDDCNADEVCFDGACTRFCQADTDCPEGQVCNGCVCVPGCPGECCEDADCPEGDVCVENLCKTPCTHRCECDAGEVCENGFCTVPEEEPPKDCTTDCDCDYAAGERCIEGYCRMP